MLHDNKNIGNSTRKNFKRFVSVATFLQKHFYKYKKRNNSFSFSKARHFSNEASFVTDTLADSLVRHTLLPLHLPIHSCDTLYCHYTCHFTRATRFVAITLAVSLVRHALFPLHLPIHSCDTLCYHYTCRFTRVGPLQSLQRAFLRDLYKNSTNLLGCLACQTMAWELRVGSWN